MNVLSELKELLNDSTIELEEQVQSLWSGYGQIIRCKSHSTNVSYIVKVIHATSAVEHPRGWNTSVGHQRKLMSYQVEANFYQKYANKTDSYCRVPQLISSRISEKYTLLIMEDLDAAGYGERKDLATWNDLAVAIKWLAYFHACYMNIETKNLWSVGTYWHLSTREDEFNAMPESEYKAKAVKLDATLNQAKFKTLLHGDAKFENLCFHTNERDVAGVDFQYTGQGSGVKDLAYLVGSCLNEEQLFEYDALVVNEYLNQLQQALVHYNIDVNFTDLTNEVETLYPIAWADFYRFLLGWNPQSWKINNFMKNKAQEGLLNIKLNEVK